MKFTISALPLPLSCFVLVQPPSGWPPADRATGFATTLNGFPSFCFYLRPCFLSTIFDSVSLVSSTSATRLASVLALKYRLPLALWLILLLDVPPPSLLLLPD